MVKVVGKALILLIIALIFSCQKGDYFQKTITTLSTGEEVVEIQKKYGQLDGSFYYGIKMKDQENPNIFLKIDFINRKNSSNLFFRRKFKIVEDSIHLGFRTEESEFHSFPTEVKFGYTNFKSQKDLYQFDAPYLEDDGIERIKYSRESLDSL